MKALLLFLNLLGGLGIFLLGIKMMSDGLQKLAGNRMRKIISAATSNRFMATFSGLLTTSIIQSSSATTVMVVGFASAGLLTLTQSLGVIFGANIGTTTTAWLISLLGFKVQITMFALPMVGIGFFAQFVQKWAIVRRTGEAMLGFGLLFLGLALIKEAIPSVNNSPEAMEWIAKFQPDNFLSLLGVVGVGTIFTVIFQSSSAVMALTLTCAAKGLIDYPTACALVLGENIGTTITANLAAIGAPRTAKRAALGHFMFNILGVTWAIIFFHPLLSLVDKIVPGGTTGMSEHVLLVSIPYHLSALHTLFNVINTGIMLIFIKQFEQLIMLLMPIKKSEEKKTDLLYLKSMSSGTPELSLEASRKEIDRMAGRVEFMLAKVSHALNAQDIKFFNRDLKIVLDEEKATDVLEYKINDFLRNLTHEQLSRDMAGELLKLFDITNHLEKMADHGERAAILLKKAREGGYFDEEDKKHLDGVCQKVRIIVKESRRTILEDDFDREKILERALERERDLNETRHALRDEKSMREYREGGLSAVSLTLYADILTSFEKIGDYALNIVEVTTGVRDDIIATMGAAKNNIRSGSGKQN